MVLVEFRYTNPYKMVEKIRQSAFETNSSSVHAFTALKKQEKIEGYTPELGEYGWENDTHRGTSFIDYLFTLYFTTEEFEDAEKLLTLLGSEKTIKEYKEEGGHYYVDHGRDKLEAVRDAIKEYGFEDVVFGFMVETGNDNCDTSPDGEFIGSN